MPYDTFTMENRKLEIRTDAGVTTSNVIQIEYLSHYGDSGEFKMRFDNDEFDINLWYNCVDEPSFGDSEGFNRGGIWTFMKNSTHLSCWFDDVLQFQYEYVDITDGICATRKLAYGIKFSGSDTASVQFRLLGKFNNFK